MSSSVQEKPGDSAEHIFKRLHPAAYLSRFLSASHRPDRRPLPVPSSPSSSDSSSDSSSETEASTSEWRDVSINVGSIATAHGSALVRMGETTVVCGVKAEIGEPTGESQGEGFIVPNIDLPALSSHKFKPGPPGDEAQTYSNWLSELLTSSKTIPLNHLCIAPSKAAWVLYIDVVCINYDGNVFDAAVLAVMAALMNARLPAARWDDDKNQVFCSRTETYPLTLGRIPLSCSFGLFQRQYILPDPTSFETPLLSSTMTIALDESLSAAMIRHEGLGGLAPPTPPNSTSAPTSGKGKGAQSDGHDGWSGEDVLALAWEKAERRIIELRVLLDESV